MVPGSERLLNRRGWEPSESESDCLCLRPVEEEFFGCFRDFSPVDGDGGGRGGYKAEIARITHLGRSGRWR